MNIFNDVNFEKYDTENMINEIMKIEAMNAKIYDYLKILRSSLKTIKRQKDRKSLEKVKS
jgi:hypothetical protein